MCVAYFNMFVSAETLVDFKDSGFSIEMEEHLIDGTNGYKYRMAIENGKMVLKTNISKIAWERDEDDEVNFHPLQKAVARTINHDPKRTFIGVDIEQQTQNVAFHLFPRQDVFPSNPR